jgi:hypothetical protein
VSADTSDAGLARLDGVLQETRAKFLDGLEQIVLRQVDPLLERTRAMLLGSSQAVVRDQAEPLLARLRQVLLEALSEAAQRQLEPLLERVHDLSLRVTEEVVQKHAAPLVAQMRTALQEGLEAVVQRQVVPMMDRARLGVQEGLGGATQLADAVVARLKVTVAEPAVQMLRDEVPQHMQWAGRRTLECILAATLFSLAAVFLLIGLVQGLEELGLRPFATYVIGGLVALGGGLVFARIFPRGKV